MKIPEVGGGGVRERGGSVSLCYSTGRNKNDVEPIGTYADGCEEDHQKWEYSCTNKKKGRCTFCFYYRCTVSAHERVKCWHASCEAMNYENLSYTTKNDFDIQKTMKTGCHEC